METDRQITRGGTELVYDIGGSGPTVVLGHSLFCDRSMWSGVVPRLREKFTVINVGLRGHGESSAEDAFTVWDLADDWLAILEAESIEKAALCGLSTGGMTAMRFAVRNPDRTCGLALIDTDADAEESLWKRFQYTALGALYRRTGIIPVRTLAKAMFAPKTVAAKSPLVADLIELMRGHDRQQLGRAMKAVFGRDSVDVSSVTVPTLVVVGEHDAATPPHRSRKLADAITGATLEVIPGAGHLTALEMPDALASLVLPFLSDCCAT